MAQRNGAQSFRRRVTEEKVASVRRRAFVQALEASGLSLEGAAREMGEKTTRYTVQRYKRGDRPVNEDKVGCSKRLWRHYHICKGKLMRELWRGR